VLLLLLLEQVEGSVINVWGTVNMCAVVHQLAGVVFQYDRVVVHQLAVSSIVQQHVDMGCIMVWGVSSVCMVCSACCTIDKADFKWVVSDVSLSLAIRTVVLVPVPWSLC